MGYQRIREIKSISAAIGNWYRVAGSKTKPTFDKIVVWAAIDISELKSSGLEEYNHPDIIVGLTPAEIGSQGCDLDYVLKIAGYVELVENDLLKAKNDPRTLPDYLVWED
jgi:hypothetical protein